MAADKSLKDLASAVYKIAENSPKIQKDVKDIRDAICGTEGILESLYGISKNMEDSKKKGNIEKLKGSGSDTRLSERRHKDILKGTSSISDILGKMLNQMQKMSKQIDRNAKGNVGNADTRRIRREPNKESNKKSKSLENMSSSIDIIERLKNIKLKDFIFAKKKMKNISKITNISKNMFRNFKNAKEAEATINFINASIDIVKKLSKIWVLSKPAQGGAKAIEKIFLGGKKPGGGLIGLFRKIHKNERIITKGAKTLSIVAKSCGSMFIAALALAGIAVVGIPAMLGALLMKGVVWLLIGTFKLLSKSAKTVLKGSLVLLLMSTSIIAFGLGLLAMSKAVKDMKLKDVGIMLASLVGVGLAVAGVGLLAVPIALGSAVLLLMGVSLGLFALSIMAWRNLDTKTAMGNIKEAVGGLREIFGLELGKGDDNRSFVGRLSGGIMDIAMSILNFGKSLFIMGTILLAGAALGMLYLGIKPWTNFDAKPAVKNIKLAVGTLKEVFGLEEPEGIGGKIGGLVGGTLDLAVTILSSGKALVTMGTIMLATAMSDIILVTLKPWAKFDAKPVINNLNIAIGGLKDVFDLKESKGLGKIGSLVGGILDMGVALVQSGKTLVTMGTLVIATAMSDLILKHLKPWGDYDSSKAMKNMGTAINGLKGIFGLKESKGLGKIGRLFGGLLDMGSALMQSGKALVTMGTLALATGMAEKIGESLKIWNDFNPSKAMENMGTAINGLKGIFGLKESKGLGKIGSLVGGILDMGVALVQSGKTLVTMGTLALATAVSDLIRVKLIPWGKYNAKPAMKNMQTAVEGLKEIFGIKDVGGIGGKLGALAGGILDMGIALLRSGKVLVQMGVITIVTGMTDVIRLYLSKWDNYNPTTALQRIGQTVTSLKTLFGLEDTGDGFFNKLGSLGGSLIDMGTTLMQSGSALMKIGTITLCVGMMEKIKEELKIWEDNKGVDTAIGNIDDAVSKLLNVFGLNQVKKEKEESGGGIKGWLKRRAKAIMSIGQGIEDFFTGTADAVGSAAKSMATNIKMTGLTAAIKMADSLKQSLTPWTSFNPDTAISNLTKSITGIVGVSDCIKLMDSDPKYIFRGGFINYFKNSTLKIKEGIDNLKSGLLLNSHRLNLSVDSFERVVKSVNNVDLEKATIVSDIFKSFSKLGTNTFDKFTRAVEKFSESCSEMISAMDRFEMNSTPTSGIPTVSGEEGTPSTAVSGSVSINNTSALAKAIADALKSMPLNAEVNMSDVRLVVNNESGRRVILSLEN